jgi:hypothetical protein
MLQRGGTQCGGEHGQDSGKHPGGVNAVAQKTHESGIRTGPPGGPKIDTEARENRP